MRTWRALKSLGCGVLRDGVYLLPDVDGTEQRLADVAAMAREAGGNAELVSVQGRDDAQDVRLRSLFDRSEGYAGLQTKLREFLAELAKLGVPDITKRLRGLRREFQEIVANDYFPGEARAQVERALGEAEAAAAAVVTPGEPHFAKGSIRRLDRDAYRGRIWATRRQPWVDRLASAWLIKRFIDRQAQFGWLESPKDCPKRALGYDFDGATFTHVGSRVTFETLLASFGLEADAALIRMGQLVHYLDVGGVPVPEAAGVVALLTGMRKRAKSDDAMLRESIKVFDHLYASFAEPA
jgi:hypothetical protein